MLLWIILVLTLATVILSWFTMRKLNAIHRDFKLHRSDLLTGATQRAEGIVEGRQLGIAELGDRVAERERVEDRADKKARDQQ